MPARELTLNVNVLDVGFHPSAWRSADLHPRSFVDVGYYREVARIAERGTLDALFLADGSAIRDDPFQKPGRSLEPSVLLGAIATETEYLGLIATASTTFNDPVELAERFLALDHVSGGRLAWNVVTTYHQGTAGNFGMDRVPDRDERYRRAGEFVDVVSALWDAAATGHPVRHDGEFYRFDGRIGAPPSAQGAPLLVQAGGSAQGRALAARTADAVFSAELTLDAGRTHYRQVKAHAARLGRDPDTMRILPGLVVVLGGTEAEAITRYEELESHLPPGYAARRISGTLGTDVTAFPLDEPLPPEVLADVDDPSTFGGSLGFREAVVRAARERDLTLRALLREFGGYGHRIAVGSPEQVADTIEHWFTERAADGFNLMPDVFPSGIRDVVDHVVPILRRRGIFRHEYGETTLRARLGLPPRTVPGLTSRPPEPARARPSTVEGENMSELSRTSAVPTDDELHARFRPIFEKIAAGAVDRERTRTLAVEEAGWLRDAGFGALRVPVEFGGSGASLSQLFALLVELAAADSNLPQALRTHFSFVEERLAGLVDTDPAVTNRWLATVGSGKLLGNATTERADSPRNSTTTLLTRHGSELRLNGTKYYSTGSLYADLIDVVALDPDGVRVAAVVPADSPGIERLDDYTGFGQRLSASGTTHFTDVVVDPADIRLAPADTPRSFRQGFLQLVQLAGLAGIARRAVDDVAGYVRDRRRSWAYGNADLPREDPLVQQVVGRVEGAAFAAAATVAAAAASMERAAADPHDADLASAAELDVYRAQSTVPDLVLGATAELFEVGGASSTDDGLALDRHWRNARTLAVHNPVVYKQRVVGDHVLNGTRPVLSLTVGRADLPGAS